MQTIQTFFREAAIVVAALTRPAYRSLRENSGLAALSVVLAFGLWIFVTDAENPTRTRVLPLDITAEPVNVASEVVVANDLAAVRVRIRVEEDVFDSLTANDFEATVDLEGLTIGEYTLPVEVRPLTTRGGLRVEDVLPEVLDVSLVALESKNVPVVISIEGEPAEGYTLGAPDTGETEVTVSGPLDKIALVTQAAGTINVEGRTESVDQAVRLEPRDDLGHLVEKLILDPRIVTVTVAIEQTTFSRPVTVSPVVSGVPETGYNVVAVSSNPVTVTIRGEQASIREITTISTQPVSVDGERSQVVKSVSLQLPQGVSVIGSPNVTVTVRIEPAQGKVRFGVPVTVTGLGAGLAVRGELPTVEVTLQGSLPDLLDLTASDVVATVDLTGKDAGTHSLKVGVTLPEGVGTTARSADPADVVLVLEKN